MVIFVYVYIFNEMYMHTQKCKCTCVKIFLLLIFVPCPELQLTTCCVSNTVCFTVINCVLSYLFYDREDREARFLASKMGIVAAFRSWAGKISNLFYLLTDKNFSVQCNGLFSHTVWQSWFFCHFIPVMFWYCQIWGLLNSFFRLNPIDRMQPYFQFRILYQLCLNGDTWYLVGERILKVALCHKNLPLKLYCQCNKKSLSMQKFSTE